MPSKGAPAAPMLPTTTGKIETPGLVPTQRLRWVRRQEGTAPPQLYLEQIPHDIPVQDFMRSLEDPPGSGEMFPRGG